MDFDSITAATQMNSAGTAIQRASREVSAGVLRIRLSAISSANSE